LLNDLGTISLESQSASLIPLSVARQPTMMGPQLA
jgi:hypothetical protein